MPTANRVYFVDSNLLLYTLDGKNADKRRQASVWMRHLWSSGRGRISWQVMHEFYWNATRKLGVQAGLAQAMVRDLAYWSPLDSSLGLIAAAWEWCESAQLAYWDGLVLAAAERCEATVLLSEDFQAGRTYGACTVWNPFARAPEA